MLVGAAVFSALEYEKDQEEKKKYRKIYRRIKDMYNISNIDMKDLTRYLHKMKHVEYALDPWSFPGSVYFSSVTITTIGKFLYPIICVSTYIYMYIHIR